MRQIANKIDNGSMIFKQGSDKIAVEFPKNMVLELKVEEEYGKKVKKSIELEWDICEEEPTITTIL